MEQLGSFGLLLDLVVVQADGESERLDSTERIREVHAKHLTRQARLGARGTLLTHGSMLVDNSNFVVDTRLVLNLHILFAAFVDSPIKIEHA